MTKKETILKSAKKSIKITLTKDIIPSEFFQDRKGLYVWNSFRDTVLVKAKETKAKAQFSLCSFDLLKTSFDKDIEKELPKKHLFSETDVCAIIAGLIEKQPKGEKGTLQNSGYANIFYTKSRVVRVGWSFGGWRVLDWHRVDDWYAGDRVFSPATEI